MRYSTSWGPPARPKARAARRRQQQLVLCQGGGRPRMADPAVQALLSWASARGARLAPSLRAAAQGARGLMVAPQGAAAGELLLALPSELLMDCW